MVDKELYKITPEESATIQNQNKNRKHTAVEDRMHVGNWVKYSEPRLATFSPFHHVANFVKDNEQNDEALLKKAEKNIKELRECYDEEATKDYDDKCLKWM
ncbi:unnamed protein product [Prunus armeniaca]|uniref:Uncharacterized protein n=1 Tax=Prunus armeniaca TaxID=36596 RepID=A0A6J5VF03_PRUAR|nr:unnamed protein product [Prunus armeniaca]